MKKIMLLIYIFSFINLANLYSQALPNTNDKTQKEIINNAKLLMSQEKYDEAIQLLDSTAKIYPSNYIFQYERAVAFFFQKRIRTSAFILDSLLKVGFEDPKIYQTLGNCYNMYGEPEKADSLFTSAIAKFPNSSMLHSELAYIKISLGYKEDAVILWEKGIFIDPTLFDNYYPLTRIYSELDAKFWSVIYGEIFLNLSQNEDKSKDISLTTFNTYFETFGTPDSSGFHPFFTRIFSNFNDSLDVPIEIAFQKTMRYALNAISKRHKYENTLEFLHLVRDKFVEYWQISDYNNMFKNPLFDFWIDLRNKGIFKVYNYMMFKEGNEEEFKKFINSNKKQVSEFQTNISKVKFKISKDYFLNKIISADNYKNKK